ncbi:Gfo/Idh/MocA family protein [Brevundimonas sp. TWP2-3-2]|uniref:Gfo/Idh/MocA family protein n=1 Tax=unclassified Brevundimonas TaxID=2622653 RepID=UPI003CFB6AEE
MVRIAVVGLGKMGISHLSIIRAHPEVDLVAVCDTVGYLLDGLSKYTGLKTYTDFKKLLAEVEIDGIILATPSASHVDMVRACLEKGIAVFCEKPFTLSPQESYELAALAASKNLTNQVGYHYRFVGTFLEARRLLRHFVIGKISHVLAEAYGPVVLKPKGSTWRTQRKSGGGCLYDYAAHPINLLNWYFGEPEAVGGTRLNKIFSADTDDEVYSTLYFPQGMSAQLSVNWSDDSHRKMTTRLTFWGAKGRIFVDRQEIQVYLRAADPKLTEYGQGWTVRYITELTENVWFYLRGEEYSAQLDHFVGAVRDRIVGENSFASAAQTDRVIGMLIADDLAGPRTGTATPVATEKLARRNFFKL